MPLHIAAATDRCAAMKLLLKKSAMDADSKEIFGQTLLFRAAQNGWGAAVLMLLDTVKVDVNERHYGGRHILGTV
jgi:ankyrin repeat protein